MKLLEISFRSAFGWYFYYRVTSKVFHLNQINDKTLYYNVFYKHVTQIKAPPPLFCIAFHLKAHKTHYHNITQKAFYIEICAIVFINASTWMQIKTMQQVSTESSSWRTCYEKYKKGHVPRHQVSYFSFHRAMICHLICGKCYKPALRLKQKL